MKLKLGQKARDTITGFTGVCVARTEWLYGCVRWTVQPQELKDGKPIESQTFDEPQLEATDPPPSLVARALAAATGGPVPEPKRHPGPTR